MSLKFKKVTTSENKNRSIIRVIVAALAASVCCVGPLLLLGLGIGGAWVGNLTALEPYRPYLMGLTLIALGYAFYKIYGKPKAEDCAPESYCANPRSDRINKITLWVSTFFVIFLLSVPYIAPILYADQSSALKDSGISENMLKEITLDVPGMNCASCPVTVQKSLIKLDGVISAEASLDTKKAIVKYDPSRVSAAQMIEAMTNAGYKSSIFKNQEGR